MDPPQAVPAWVPCATSSELVAYTDAAEGAAGEEPVSAHLASRAIAWPDREGLGYAVVVDVPLSPALLARMKEETGIEYIVGGDISALQKECGTPLPGRDFGSEERPASSMAARKTLNPLAYPFDWVMSQGFVDWRSGAECDALISIRMTLGEVYKRVALTSGRRVQTGEGANKLLAELVTNPTLVFLFILALIVMLFLVIEAVAFIMGLALARSITGSVHELFDRHRAGRLGDFTHKIPIRSRDQLGELAESFNSMTRSIVDLLRSEGGEGTDGAGAPHRADHPDVAAAARARHDPRARRHRPLRTRARGRWRLLRLHGVRRHASSLLIADVSGKGTSAALYMAELKGLMLSLSQLHTSPRELLIDANRIISRHLDSKSFITITYAVVDVGRGRSPMRAPATAR